MALFFGATTLVSCGDDDEEDATNDPNGTEKPNDNGNGGEQTDGTIAAFFPEGYDASNVAAWYCLAEVQQDGTKRTTAVYIFNDNTVLTTNHKIKSDGTEKREIDFKGSMTMTGDYENGTASVPDMNMEVAIVNGTLTAMNETFTKQDNSKIPAPTTVTADNTGDNGGDNGNNNQNGDNNQVNLTVLITQLDDVTSSSVIVSARIDGFSGLDLDASKLTYGFVVADKGNMPTIESNIMKTENKGENIDKSGMFIEDLEGDAILDKAISIRAYATYDGVTFYSNEQTSEKGGYGDGHYGVPQAYLPKEYANKTIAAWYTLKDIDKGGNVKIEAVFLFNDNTVVVTKNKTYSAADGREPQSEIIFSGTYVINEGDYENGSATVPNASDMGDLSITIIDGNLTAFGETFTKESNQDSPTPSK